MLIFYIAFAFLSIRWMIALGNLLTRPRLPALTSDTIDLGAELPLVSILIPARNEANNLRHLFSQLQRLTYPNLEVIILNDHSEDETEKILQQQCQHALDLSYLNSQDLPSGWLGKHWACHQLAQAAKGDYFLFLDADISQLESGLIPITLQRMRQLDLSLLSLFPDQEMKTSGEKMVIPIMHYLLLSLLPLWWIYRMPFPSMAAANGQFMLFEASSYREHRWHAQVKQTIVEDIAIMQCIKKARLKGMTFLANGWIRCRMYHSLNEGVQGFSKNFLSGFRNQILGLAVYLCLVCFVWVGWILYLPIHWLVASIVLIVSLRIWISMLANQSLSNNLLLHPIQIGLMTWIGLLSIFKRFRGSNQWKGRNVSLP